MVRPAVRFLRAFVALLAAAVLLAPSAAQAERGGSAMVRVAATIMSYVKVTGLANPATLEITPEDVARGYVDVEAGTTLTVVTNSNDGYVVTATGDPATVARIALRVGGLAGADRVRVPSAAFARSLLRVGYRLYLGSGVSPGRHPWPVAIGVSAE